MISSKFLLSAFGTSKSKSKDILFLNTILIIYDWITKMRRIIRLAEGMIAYLANDQYHVNIVRNGRDEFQIKS